MEVLTQLSSLLRNPNNKVNLLTAFKNRINQEDRDNSGFVGIEQVKAILIKEMQISISNENLDHLLAYLDRYNENRLSVRGIGKCLDDPSFLGSYFDFLNVEMHHMLADTKAQLEQVRQEFEMLKKGGSQQKNNQAEMGQIGNENDKETLRKNYNDAMTQKKEMKSKLDTEIVKNLQLTNANLMLQEKITSQDQERENDRKKLCELEALTVNPTNLD